MKAAAGEGYATATDLADWLVRTLKMPFRDAHHVTGRIVGEGVETGVPLHELPLKDMQAIEPRITEGGAGRAVGGSVGEKPHQLWRNRAEKRAGAGQGVAQAAGKGAKVGLSLQNSAAISWSSRPRQNRAIFVWCRRIGDFVVNRKLRPTFRDGPSSCLGVAALALGGCGRKGGLDLPPNAASQASSAAAPPGRYRSRAGRAAARSIRLRAPMPRPPRREAARKPSSSIRCSTELSHESLRLSQRRAARRGGQSVSSWRRRSARHSIAIRPRPWSVTTGCSPTPSPARRRWCATP